MEMIKLDSVGCWLDLGTGDTFPALADSGLPDYQAPFNLVDVEVEEWFDALSPRDGATCTAWLAGFKAGKGDR